MNSKPTRGPIPKKKITSLAELAQVLALNLQNKKEMERSLSVRNK